MKLKCMQTSVLKYYKLLSQMRKVNSRGSITQSVPPRIIARAWMMAVVSIHLIRTYLLAIQLITNLAILGKILYRHE